MDISTQTGLLNRLRAHLADGTTDMATHALRVPASHYVSEEQLADEIDALFLKRPQLVALTPHIPNPGDYLTHDALNTSLLLVRDKAGVARAYINACRHRGARLAEGRGSKKSFSCPFHAWNWGLDGQIIARPKSNDGFDTVEARYDQLLELPCYETTGMIFVLLEGDDIESKVHDLMGAALADIAGFNIAATQYIDRRVTELDCNYKFLVSPRKTIDREFDKPAQEQTQVLPYTTTEYLIAPNAMLTHQVDHIQFWRVYPLDGAQRCLVELNVFWPNPADKPMDEEAWRKARLNVDLVWQVTTDEDFPQSVNIHKNLASGVLPDLVFGKNEPALIRYHQNIADAIGSDRLIAIGND